MGSMVMPIRADQLLLQFLLEPFDTVHHNTDTLDMCMKKYYFGKNNFGQICSFVNLDNFCALFPTWVPW